MFLASMNVERSIDEELIIEIYQQSSNFALKRTFGGLFTDDNRLIRVLPAPDDGEQRRIIIQ